MAKQKSIVAFCCENSSLQAAETLRDRNVIKDIDIVSLPCTGKIEIAHILKCFENGYQGVLVLGCPIDNCQYIKGNLRARKRIDMVKKALRDVGIDEQRVHMDFLSSLDSHKFVTAVEEMKNRIGAAANG